MRISKIVFKFTFLIIFLIITLCALSQSSYIQGVVKDSDNNSPLAYTCVYLKNSNDSIVMKVYSDDKGYYKIPLLAVDRCEIVAEFLGYETWNKNVGEIINDKSSEYNIDILLKLKADFLTEVTISEEAANITRRIDRTVFKIDDRKKENANDLYDILKTLPGVIVDESSNTIRFKGGQPELLVDNMPANIIYPKLEMINLDDVDLIELIDRSSIYGGEGQGGIINIKLKKDRIKKFGAFVSNETDYSFEHKKATMSNNFVNFNYLLGPFLIFNNFDNPNTFSYNKFVEEGSITSDNISYSKNATTNTNSKTHPISDYIGFYIPAENLGLLFAYGWEATKYKSLSKLDRTISLENDFYNELHQDTDYRIKNRNNYVITTLFFNTKKNAEFSFSYNYADVKEDKKLVTDQYYNTIHGIITDSIYNYSTTINSMHKTNMFDVYYNHPINSTSRFNIHTSHFSTKQPKSIRNYFIFDNEYKPYYQSSETEQYRTIIGANYGKRFGKFLVDATIDYNYTRLKGEFTRNISSVDTIIPVSVKQPFISPSVRLSYIVNNQNDFYIGYNYQNSVSKIDNYIPYLDKSDPLNWSSGNADLNQDLYHKAYFAYRFMKDSLNFSAELFYKLTQNGVIDIKIPITSAIILTQPENAAYSDRIGADISFWHQITKQWMISFNSTLYHSTLKAQDFDLISGLYNISPEKITKKQFGALARLRIQHRFKYKKSGNPTCSLWINYYSREVGFTGYTNQYLDADFAISKRFFNNKLFINIAAENFLSGIFTKKSYYDYLGIDTKTSNYYSVDKFRIRLYVYFIINDGDRGFKDIITN
jgi:hypothetical protein